MRARWPGLAATYVAAVVGAGFASGREVHEFFAVYGRAGLLGTAVSGALFALLGALAMRRVAALGHRHGGDLLRDICGPQLGWMVDWVSLLGFVLVEAAVLSTAGALGRHLLDWPPWAGTCVLALALALAGLGGRRVYVALNLVVAPSLLVTVLGLGVALAPRFPWYESPDAGLGGHPSWPLAALLYVAYNLTLALAGMCAVTDAGISPREAAAGGAAGGALLGLMCLALTGALLGSGAGRSPSELPLATALRGTWWQYAVYPFLLMAAVWTTGTAAAFAVAQRLAPSAPGPVATAVPLLAVAPALIGLTRLIAGGYPILGYAGLPVLAGVALLPWRRPRPHGPHRGLGATMHSTGVGGDGGASQRLPS
jgi:uncharacterized membrane protein YkvI